MDYSEAKNQVNDISNRIAQERNRCAQGRKAYADAVAVLNGMPTQYATLVAEIGNFPDTDPYVQLKAEFNVLVAEFTALSTVAQNTLTAIDAV